MMAIGEMVGSGTKHECGSSSIYPLQRLLSTDHRPDDFRSDTIRMWHPTVPPGIDVQNAFRALAWFVSYAETIGDQRVEIGDNRMCSWRPEFSGAGPSAGS